MSHRTVLLAEVPERACSDPADCQNHRRDGALENFGPKITIADVQWKISLPKRSLRAAHWRVLVRKRTVHARNGRFYSTNDYCQGRNRPFEFNEPVMRRCWADNRLLSGTSEAKPRD